MKNLLIISGTLLLFGCNSLPSIEQYLALGESKNDNEWEQMAEQQGLTVVDSFGSVNRPSNTTTVAGGYQASPLTRHVGDYVRNMAQDLVSNMEYVTETTPVAVTHFSILDSNLNETNLFGQQMAESFVHEFHKFRMPVVEYKATQFIRVTEHGDFVMTRDFIELTNTTPVQYVLTGTMTKHQGGYIVNARMLGMRTNVVVATAQSFIPSYIVDALVPGSSGSQGEMVDGIKIIKGE